ncbi:hypothetical protein [Halorubrum tropicale]|jgi:hypothetical protein|uniref:hypothetical protein n=1 Tax=Halorubrum tropicale TaxID=1765655 RepID=UPI000AE100DE|nr:hypothetical protein [Halorubrum tropicale]
MLSDTISIDDWWVVMIASAALMLGFLFNGYYHNTPGYSGIYFLATVLVTAVGGGYGVIMTIRSGPPE